MAATIPAVWLLARKWKKALYLYAILPGIYIALRLPGDIILWLISEVP